MSRWLYKHASSGIPIRIIMSAAADAALSLEELATRMDDATNEAASLFERAKSQQKLVGTYVERHGKFDTTLTTTSEEINATPNEMDPQWTLMKKLKSEQPALGAEMKALHVKLLEIVLEQASISDEASKSAGLLVKLNETMHEKHKEKHATQVNKHNSELQTEVGKTAKVQKSLDTLHNTHKAANEEKVEVNRQFLEKVSTFVDLVEQMVTGGDNFMTTLREMGGHLTSIRADLGAFGQHAGKTKQTLGNAAAQVVAQNVKSKKPDHALKTPDGFPALKPSNPPESTVENPRNKQIK